MGGLAALSVLSAVPGRVRLLIDTKLGRCSRCMRAALLGTAGTWVVVLAAALAGVPALGVGIALVAAGAFSALSVAHAVAYVVRPLPVGTPCCGNRQPLLLVRRPALQAMASLPAAFGLTQVLRVGRAAAQPQTAPPPPPPATPYSAVFRSTLDCSAGAGGTACTCTFTATFGYDFVREGSKIRLTQLTMQWGEGSTGTCQPEINKGSGAFDFQCVGDSKVCRLTGGNLWQCACDTTIQFLNLPGHTAAECVCPNEQNRTAYAQGVCGPPVWIAKSCSFEWVTLDFAHKVTCDCPDGHISRGFLNVVAIYKNGALTFGGDWVPNEGNPVVQ